MIRLLWFLPVAALLLQPVVEVRSQESPSRTRITGEVSAIDRAAGKITVTSAKGEAITIEVNDKTSFKRVQAGATSLDNAVTVTIADIGAGDRVAMLGETLDGGKRILARQLVLMSKADLTRKQELDREAWRQHGIVGTITGVDAEKKQISVRARSSSGSNPVTIAADASTKIRRYTPEAISFSEAKPSSFESLKVGDQLRALGERSSDGATIAAQEIVAGSFRLMAGTITAVDGRVAQIKFNDLVSGKEITLALKPATLMRRVPKEIESSLTQLVKGASEQAMPAADLQAAIERQPAVRIDELKPGEVALVSTVGGENPDQGAAIALLTGVEPLVKVIQSQVRAARSQGNYNLGLPDSLAGLGIGLP